MATALQTKINQQDLKIYPSERLTQNDDGGGMPLGTPLTGALNELFQLIPSIARVNGAFFAALEYMGVQRADDEPLIGAFAAITKPPSDPTVSYLMFPATKFGESRADILKRIEAYNVATIESRMTLLSTQSANSKVVQAYQSLGEPLPTVGDVYCLRQDKAGYPLAEQYVQVTRVTSEEREFTDANGKKFKKIVIKLEISSKLIADFIGVDYPVEGYVNNPCKIRETGVADAAQYYGVKPLAQAIVKDMAKIQVTDLMEKIVPTNQISTPLLDLTAAGQRQTLFDGAKSGTDGIVTLAVSKQHNAGQISSLYFGNAITPNSVIIASSAGDITDKGGTLYRDATAVGSVDYARGTALISEPSFAAYLNTLKFRPASVELKVSDTMRIQVDINNRSDSYTFNINPPPAVGTLMVSYRSQGRWYDLTDTGSGVLRGASAQHGSGNINFATGSGNISTGELPDVGSAILLSWGTRTNYFNRSGGQASAKLLLQLSQDAAPSSLVLTWNNGTAKTARSDAWGNVTGDWTGKYDPQTRQVRIDTGANFNHPAGVLDVTAQYSTGEKAEKVLTSSQYAVNSGTVTFTLSDTFIRGTMQIVYEVFSGSKKTITLREDANGNLVDDAGEVKGAINYDTKQVSFNSLASIATKTPIYSQTDFGLGGYPFPDGTGRTVNVSRTVISGYQESNATVDITSIDNNGITLRFYSATAGAVTDNLKSDTLEVDLLPTFAEVVTPASVNFKWGKKSYFDKQGQIFTDLNTTTGAASLAGTIDYARGTALLKTWQWTTGAAPDIVSLVTSVSGNAVDAVTFRTPQSPIRAGSLQLRATAIDGSLITARATYGGALTATDVNGSVDAEYGVADVRFGQWVANDANAQAQSWYNPANVDGGQVWHPVMVFAETITYNADAYTYLPIDSNVVKIDTVRLPQDGRVPIFRRGDSILIRNAQTDNLGSAFTGGQTIQLSRTDVDRICLMDADNKPVLGDLWDYDLDAGTITFKPSIDLSSYKMPLKATHAQEQRNRIVDLDIDGTLSLLFATNRNYPIQDTYVSSLLIGDDLQVRVSVPFTQRSWNNVWQDTPVGDQLLNKLKLTDYPMVLTDDGAITDRWMVKFISGSQFELYSEALGFVGKYDTLTNLAPINPATGKPYFTIDKRAFGTDTPWAVQDVIRFNTWGTLMPVWVLCAVQPNPNPPTGTDGFEQYLFGDTTEITV